LPDRPLIVIGNLMHVEPASTDTKHQQVDLHKAGGDLVPPLGTLSLTLELPMLD
jgi:hypothetical protein